MIEIVLLVLIPWRGGYNSIMSQSCLKVETRGRPRKNVDEKLPPISRKLFSQHCAVFYACCMVYVLEVFLKTKQEKRIGHSEGGFTIYQKLSSTYCFESLEDDVKEWGYSELLTEHPSLWQFVRTVNGCAPKLVFRELVSLIVAFCEIVLTSKAQAIQELDIHQAQFCNTPEIQLNKQFKYIRFSPAALKQLKIQKWGVQVGKKVRELWRPFLKIIASTVLCVIRGQQKNKYFRPFFSDAEHPEDTIIGQLNLQQIVDERQRLSPPNLGFIKLRHSEEQLDQTVKKLQFDNSPSLSDRISIQNRRPITLITFPSNSKIEMNSPIKLNLTYQISPKQQEEEKEEFNQDDIEEKQPCKKIKSD